MAGFVPTTMNSKRKNNSDQCVVPFHTLINTTLTAGAVGILLNPNGLSNAGRLLTEADSWAHFRIKKLSFRLHPSSTITGPQAAGLVGGNQDVPPATLAAVMELIPSTFLGVRSTVPTEWVRVAKNDLSGPLPWYKSIAGAADTTEEAPGQLVVAGTGTEGFTLEIRGVVEFKVAVSAANTPAELALRARLRSERVAREKEAAQQRVLALLGCQPASNSTTSTVILPTGRVVVRE